MADKLKVLDLFSGIGGFSLGLERTGGFETVAFCEIDPFCRKVLVKHWPKVKQYEDVRELTSERLAADGITAIDVIAGGFPCKQTSNAAAVHGRRNGLAGEESGLFEDMARIIGELRPRWCLVENPLGVGTWTVEITRRLEAFGYGVSRPEFSASDFGAPHLRGRFVFVANADGTRLAVPRPPASSAATSNPWGTTPGDFWREVEPGAWRMDDGLPHRLDRLRSLGNAVVPQIPELIGRAILSTLQQREAAE